MSFIGHTVVSRRSPARLDPERPRRRRRSCRPRRLVCCTLELSHNQRLRAFQGPWALSFCHRSIWWWLPRDTVIPWCHGCMVTRFAETGLLVQPSQHLRQDAARAVPSILVDQVVEGDSGDLVLAGLDASLFVGVDDARERPLLGLGEAVGCGFLAERADGTPNGFQC